MDAIEHHCRTNFGRCGTKRDVRLRSYFRRTRNGTGCGRLPGGRRTANRWRRAALLLLSLLMIDSNAARATPAAEQWHVLSIDGTPVGSVHEVFARETDESVTTESVVMVLNRLGARIETGNTVQSVENDSGDLLRVNLEVRTSEQSMRVLAFLEDDQWVTRSAGAGVPDRRQAMPEPLRGPRAVTRLLATLSAPGDSITYDAFVAMTMQPGRIRAELVGFETVGGIEMRVIEEHLPGVPAPMIRVIDEQGRSVITRLPSPFGLTETKLADKVAATLAQAGGDLPEEVFEATILKTGVRLPQPRDLEYLELELTHRNPALGWPALDSTNQRVLSQNDEHLILAIERLYPRQSMPMDTDVGSDLEPFLSANAMLQTTQPELLELVQTLVADQTDRWQAALTLRRWVSENLSFDAGVMLATSSEVLANRRGTCTEFAVLLTTLARSAGIPARYVQGYVYAHGMLAGHAWTEVRIGDDWLALDAAVPSEGTADAARFAIVWTDFNDGPGELNAGASMQLFGQIDARVIAWRVAGGEEQRFSDGAPVPEAVGGRYSDRVQGIEWSLPEAWTVVDYQQTWPSNLIAAAEAASGDRIELRWISGLPWEMAGEDWIGPRLADAEHVEREPFGRAASWLVEHGDEVRFIQAGTGGHWQLSGDDREQLRAAARGLVLPSS